MRTVGRNVYYTYIYIYIANQNSPKHWIIISLVIYHHHLITCEAEFAKCWILYLGQQTRGGGGTDARPGTKKHHQYKGALRIRIRQSVGLLCLLDARQTKTLSHLVVLFCGKSDGVRGFWSVQLLVCRSTMDNRTVQFTSYTTPLYIETGSGRQFPNLKPHKQGAVRPLSQWPQPFQTIRR